MELGDEGYVCVLDAILRCVTQVTVSLILMDYICGIAYKGGAKCIKFN